MVVVVAARVVERALDGVDLHVDADLGPVALHQLQRVHGVRIERRDDVDGEEHLLPVGTQAEALRVLLVVAELVEDRVRLLGIVVRELARQLLVIPGMARARPGLVGLGLAEIDDVDDLLAVDAQRERLAELLVGEHLPHLRVLVRDVQVDLNLLRAGCDELDKAVVALLHVLRERRLVLQGVDVALLDVQAAGDRVEHQGLDVLRDVEVEPVDIGELVALLVDLPEVGVALHA